MSAPAAAAAEPLTATTAKQRSAAFDWSLRNVVVKWRTLFLAEFDNYDDDSTNTSQPVCCDQGSEAAAAAAVAAAAGRTNDRRRINRVHVARDNVEASRGTRRDQHLTHKPGAEVTMFDRWAVDRWQVKFQQDDLEEAVACAPK
jgi:hypothetical protein